MKAIPNHVKIIFASIFILMFALCLMNYNTWATRVDYSFGYITPLFAAYIIYDRKKSILEYFSRADSGGAQGGLARLLCGALFGLIAVFSAAVIALFLLVYAKTGQRGGPFFAASFGIVWLNFSLFYFASGYSKNIGVKERLKFVSLFVFPCFIWLVSTPLFGAAEEAVSLKLLSAVASITHSVMDTLGFVVTLRGNTIEFPGGSVGVAEACSGIRSLTACVFAGSFLAAAMLDKFWKKLLLVLTSMFFAFFFNLVRALFLSFWAYENGPDSISGFVHDAAGYFILGMTVLCLLELVWLFNINPVPKEYRQSGK